MRVGQVDCIRVALPRPSRRALSGVEAWGVRGLVMLKHDKLIDDVVIDTYDGLAYWGELLTAGSEHPTAVY